ncbi:GNAT family N-acetyltransferase [Vibrio sp. HN007]|uniref:GNAT family N-acetyltransferase n=1 Tax=Vibrio iocasae TaxID=3098914 RepID=UPI0035D4317A
MVQKIRKETDTMDDHKVISTSFDSSHKLAIKTIRNTVFTKEQNVDPDIDFDGQDLHSIHAVVFVGKEAVATGRILSDGHIGRVAVLKEHRGKQYGTLILSELERVAVTNNYKRIYLGSQLHAVNFYSKLGYTIYGEQYEEAGIQHRLMEKHLA